MSQRELGKQKAQRIDVLHYRQRTWLTWLRWLAMSGALLTSGTYVLWVLWLDRPATEPSNSRSVQLSTGPLSQVHASFENDCQACHSGEAGVGLSPDTFQWAESKRLENQTNKCGECHSLASADPSRWHFREKLAHPDLDQDCARCHQDHQGRNFDLAHVSDAMCTQCHQNLAAACKAGIKSELKNSVSNFTVESHGSVFRSLAADTGRIKFNHAEHMQAGQVAVGHKGAFQANWLPESRLPRYQTVSRDGVELVQLDCKDCHEPLKSSASARLNGVSREEGSIFGPVSFEKHCADCHRMNYAGQTSQNLPLPHYASTQEFKRLLSFNFRTERPKGQIAMAADKALNADELKSLPASNRPTDLNETIVDDAVRSVFQRCQQCHLAEDVNEQAPGSALQLALAGQEQSLIPARWLQYGFYDHATHAKIKCDYCHPGTRARDEVTSQKIEQIRAANPGSLTNAVDHTLVKINSIASCVVCHRPSDLPDDPSLDTAPKRAEVLGESHQPIRASDACTLCHRYHWTRPAPSVSP